jgi:hypothetical protein
MSDKPISPLRQRMIDDMTARRFSEKVQKASPTGLQGALRGTAEFETSASEAIRWPS